MLGGHHGIGKVGIGAGAQHQVAAAIAGERTVGTVGRQGDATIVGRIDGGAVGILQGYPREPHQLAGIGCQIVGIAQLAHVELLEQGLGLLRVGIAKETVVGAPHIAAHAADGLGTRLGVGVDAANLQLLAVAAQHQTFQVDENLLAHGQESEQTALVDTDEQGTGGILHGKLIVDIAADVVASDDTFYFDILGHLGHAARRDDVGIFLFQLCDGDDATLCQFVVAVRRLRQVGLRIIFAHTGCKECADEC